MLKSGEDLREIQKRLSLNDPAALRQLYGIFSDKLFQFAHALLRSREMMLRPALTG